MQLLLDADHHGAGHSGGRSYLAGDVTGLKNEDIAVAVIHEELDCLKAAQQRAKIA